MSEEPESDPIKSRGGATNQAVNRSVATYKANGNKNGGKGIDFTNPDTILGMADSKPVLPGMYRLPVCSGDAAHSKWDSGKRTDDNYPC